MESAISVSSTLLFAQQTGVLNPIVDIMVPIYTIAVLYFIYNVQAHKLKRLRTLSILKSGSVDTAVGPSTLPVGSQKDKKEESMVLDDGTHYTSESSAVIIGGGVSTSNDNFSGTWKSIPSKNVNYEEFLAFQNVPYLKRKVATSTTITHIIDHQGADFKLEVQPLDMKTTFSIDGEPTISYIGKKSFEDKMTRGPNGELILVKTNKEDGTEITATRILKDSKTLVMKQSVKNLNTGKEVFAEQTFDKAA